MKGVIGHDEKIGIFKTSKQPLKDFKQMGDLVKFVFFSVYYGSGWKTM